MAVRGIGGPCECGQPPNSGSVAPRDETTRAGHSLSSKYPLPHMGYFTSGRDGIGVWDLVAFVSREQCLKPCPNGAFWGKSQNAGLSIRNVAERIAKECVEVHSVVGLC